MPRRKSLRLREEKRFDHTNAAPPMGPSASNAQKPNPSSPAG